MKIALPRFSGLSSSINPRKFMEDFEDYCTLFKIKQVEQILALFSLHLDHEAQWWYHDLPPDQKDTWEHCKEAFTDRYIEKNTLNSPDFLHTTNIFDTMQLSSHQDLTTYYYTLKDKATTLQKSDTDLLNRFIDGLPQDLAFFVRCGNPATPEAALTAARNGEAHGYRGTVSSPTKSVNTIKHSPNTQDTVAELSNQVKQLTEQVTRLSTRHQNTRPQHNPYRGPQYRPPHQQQGPRGRNFFEGPRYRGPPPNHQVKCQLCLSWGHSARVCRSLK